MKIPLNRVIAFLGPYISLIAAALAAWLVAKLNILDLPGIGDQATLATYVAGALTALLTAALTWAGQSKWLKGHHIDLAVEGQKQAALLASNETPLDSPIAGTMGWRVDPEVVDGEVVDGAEPGEDDLPDDETELAFPPTGEPTVVQPSQDEPPSTP